MSWEYDLASGLLHLTAIISMLLAFYAWGRRSIPGALLLSLLMVSITIWAFTSGLETAANDLDLKIILTKCQYLGVLSAPIFFLGFTMQYTQRGHWITPARALLVSIIPLAGLILAATNELHNWVWTEVVPVASGGAIYQHGPVYYALVIYSYLLILGGVGVLLSRWRVESRINRARVIIILLASSFPMLAGIMYGSGLNPIPGFDIVSVSFFLTGLVVAYGVFGARIFNIVPAARENLVENMQDGVLVLDQQDRVVDINPAAQKAIGLPAKEVLRKPASRLPAEWARLFQGEGSFTPRREITIQRNPHLHVDVQTTQLYDHQRQPSGRLIVFRDITERRDAELDLALRANELSVLNQVSTAITSGLDLALVLRTLHEQCRLIIQFDVFYVALYNETTGVIEMPLYHEKSYWIPPPRNIRKDPGLTGYIINSRQSLHITDTLDPQDKAPIPPIRLGGTPTRTYVGIPLIQRDKVIGVLSVQSYQPDAYDAEQIRLLETLAVQAAIAIENARLYGEVQRMAIVDELTDIYNYRGLIELGKREVERARRFNHPLAVLFFDIDGFRNFNNTYSHTIGNMVLKEITRRCKGVLRSVDVFTRYGGDEFVVLLTETDQEMAMQVAQRLIVESAAARIAIMDDELSVTISIGMAMLTDEVKDIGMLIHRANQAEHRAKAIGNCVEIYTDGKD